MDIQFIANLFYDHLTLVLTVLLVIYYGKASYYKAAYKTLSEQDNDGWQDETMFWRRLISDIYTEERG